MIPVRLRLRNFLCYRDIDPLDFTSIHLACLSGENGHGKSALLDAMTWALWGKARASTDELIHFNETEMEVEFEFQLGDVIYRVIRKRDRRRRGESQLELQVEVDGVFHPMTETSVRKTQAKIDEILRMDYDTFINSAFLLQGRADEFTTKQPMERKRILAQILGLSIYDEFEERAKEKARQSDEAGRIMAGQIAEWEKEIERRPQYERELAEAELRARQASERLDGLDQLVQELRRERQDLEAKETARRALADRLEQIRQDLAGLEQRLASSQQEIRHYEAILADRDRIEKGYEELVAARRQNDDFNRRLQEVVRLNARKSEMEMQLQAKRQELMLQKQRLEDKIQELIQRASMRERREAELRSMGVPLDHLAQVEAALPGFREQLESEAQEVTRLDAQMEQLRAEIRELAEKEAVLSTAEAQCPLCGSALTAEHQARLLAEMQAAASEKQRAVEEGERRRTRLAESVNHLRAEIRKAEKELENRANLYERKARLEAAIEEATQAELELQTVRSQLDDLVAYIRRGEWASEIQTALAAIEQGLASVNYNEAAHREIQALVDQLSSFDEKRSLLLAAGEKLGQERAHAAELERLAEGRRQEVAAVQQEIALLTNALQRQQACIAELRQAEEQRAGLAAEESLARQLLGAARQKLDACRNLEAQREQKKAELDRCLREKAIYDELRLAFSKRGVQAMIIEQVVPELEDEANAILFRMTDGRMRVKLDTQRETRAGDVVETLDITVSDELGPRAYELFSGGEAFRINFALRVALSKLLARRAGASLRTLIIDEGFGTQDAQGRERLIESINAIQSDFDKVLVITHIDEIKEAFPVRIEVFKTPYGSQVRVS